MGPKRNQIIQRITRGPGIVIPVLWFFLLFPVPAQCETYGLKDPSGKFQPKITIDVGGKEIIIKKTNLQDKFRSVSLTLNQKNSVLIRNVGLLNVEWINANGKPGKAMPFAGTRYDPSTRRFEDSMGKSVELRILDKGNRSIFAGKTVADLFEIRIDDQPLFSSESVVEKDRTVQMGTGRDVSINLDKSSIVFNENNLKKGEILNVDNRSGMNQILGVELPDRGLLYYQVIRKPEQTKIPRDTWKRFTVGSDSGIFIVVIPEPDAAHLAMLDGKDIVIKIFQGNSVRETLKVPIKISSDLRGTSGDGTARSEIAEPQPVQRSGGPKESLSAKKPEVTDTPSNFGRQSPVTPPVTQAKASESGDLRIWLVQIVNLGLLISLGVYGIFFLLPKIQVLQDRLARNEMFIHSSREAIREEMDRVKEEILAESQTHPDSR
jgi:hypothetical protein